jgi:hypothetical protein
MGNIIDKDKIWEAAEQAYRENGTYPSVRAISTRLIEAHGSGGTTATVTRILKEWRQTKDNFSSPETPTVPIELAQAQDAANRSLWSVAMKLAKLQLADRVSMCQQREFDNEQEKFTALEAADDYQRELVDCRAKLAGCEKRLEQAYEEIAKGTVPIREANTENINLMVSNGVVSAELVATNNRLKDVSEQLGALKLQLDERRAKFEEELRSFASQRDALQAENDMQMKLGYDLNVDLAKMSSENTELKWELQQARVDKGVDTKLIVDYQIQLSSSEGELRMLREFRDSAIEILKVTASRQNTVISELALSEKIQLPSVAQKRDDLIAETGLRKNADLQSG